MKPLPLVAISLAVLAAQAQAAAQDDLVGCWKATNIAQVFADGSRSLSQGGRCTLRFKRDEFVSSCAYSQTPVTSTYRYNVTRPGVYTATMTSSTASTQLIGTTREYEYVIDGQTLSLITRPKAAVPPTPNAAIRIESESIKTPCIE